MTLESCFTAEYDCLIFDDVYILTFPVYCYEFDNKALYISQNAEIYFKM